MLKNTVVLTIPKSGTHLIQKAIKKIAHQKIHWIGGDSRSILYGFAPEIVDQSQFSLHHLFEHFNFLLEDQEKYNKVILIRDPRDVIVSHAHWLEEGILFAPKEYIKKVRAFSWDEKIREMILLPDAYYGTRYFVRNALKWMRDPYVFICRFEDLIGAEGGGSAERQKKVLIALASHIGYTLSEERAEHIGAALFGDSYTFYKGQIGTWKEAFNEENKELFKQILGQELIDLGYETHSNY